MFDKEKFEKEIDKLESPSAKADTIASRTKNYHWKVQSRPWVLQKVLIYWKKWLQNIVSKDSLMQAI